MFGKLAYYLLVIPASYLPMFVLYLLTDIFFLMLITLVPYRREVVRKNLKNSFPNKSRKELRKIERQFYRHFTDLLGEACKNLTISKKNLSKRVKVTNPEVVNRFYEDGRNVLLISAHYNNWEWMITAQNFLLKHQAVGVGMPLSNPFWNKKINGKRERFGMRVTNAKELHNTLKNLHQEKEPWAMLLLADQSTGDSKKSYWTNFLNQQTAVIYGPEYLAIKGNDVPIFYSMKKVKRGCYEITFDVVTDKPRETAWGEITEYHVKALEKQIVEAPQYWIWSHKRWKREVPKGLEALKTEQRKKFKLLIDSVL